MVQIQGKNLNWGTEAESFSGTVVYEVAGTLHIGLGETVEGGALPEILAQEAVGILDGDFLPGVIGLGEVVVGAEIDGDIGMPRELASVVESNGFENVLIR